MNQPVKKDQELEVTIESIASKGDGVVKVDGLVVFVPGTKKEQRCRIKVTKVFEKYAFADVVSDTAQ